LEFPAGNRKEDIRTRVVTKMVMTKTNAKIKEKNLLAKAKTNAKAKYLVSAESE